MLVKQPVTSADCKNRNCRKGLRKKEFKSITIQGSKVLRCNYCGYYNSPEIFCKYKEVATPKLVFGIDNAPK